MIGSEEMRVVFNLSALRRQLAAKDDRDISWREMAEQSDISESTLINIANNRHKQIHVETLRKLLVYFHSRGMNIGIGDLFREERPA